MSRFYFQLLAHSIFVGLPRFPNILLSMKHVGSVFPYKEWRGRELLRAFYEELHQCKFIRMDEIFERVAKHACSRFWVSEERAAIVIAELLRGGEFTYSGAKGRMYREIYERCLVMRETCPTLGLGEIVSKVVNSNAPEFYMSPAQVKFVVNKMRSAKRPLR